MSENKEDKRIFLTPAGAMVALICFFLPWVKISCGRTVKTFSGPEIGGIFWLVLVAALVILVVFFYFRNKTRIEKTKPVAILASLFAFAVMFIKYFSLVWGQMNVLVRAGTKPMHFNIHVGAIGTVIGFVLVIIGSLFIKTGKRQEQKNGG